MIASLKGIVTDKLTDRVIIEVAGVGYGLFITNENYNQLKLNDITKFFVYEHLRENIHELYGFSDRDSQALFEKLLDVSGVGPKMALSLINIATPRQLMEAIANGDTAFVCQANGVGRRLAERIIVELKDKMAEYKSNQVIETFGQEIGYLADEAVTGLVTLGYSQKEARQLLINIDSNLPVADRIKQALKS